MQFAESSIFVAVFYFQKEKTLKKVLVITYYWPPAGGIGVLRCLKFVKYLRQYGWEPVVYTVADPSYAYIDHNNEKDIPEGITVLRGRAYDPTALFKKLSGRKKNDPLQNIVTSSTKKPSFIDNFGIWVRGNFFIPDARFLWAKPSISYLSEYLKEHKIDAILTDGPPHTNTLIGLRLSQMLNIPWLADFQDPWTQVDYYAKMKIGKRADQKHKRLEQEVFQTARKITIASPSWKTDLEAIGAKNVDVIYYGYDESDFLGFKKQPSPVFSIFHAGLLGSDRNISIFFETIRELLSETPALKAIIRMEFAGEVDHSIKEAVELNGLSDITIFSGMLSRKTVIEKYQSASLLLLPVNQAENAKGRIPGKLFEYLRTYTPILVFGPEDGDVKQIVEDKKLGISVSYERSESIIKQYLLSLLIQFNPLEPVSLQADIHELSNEHITGKIAYFLHEITQ